jgi:hypothetical protein
MTTEIFCFYLQNRLIQTSQTGGLQYNDTPPLVFPCLTILVRAKNLVLIAPRLFLNPNAECEYKPSIRLKLGLSLRQWRIIRSLLQERRHDIKHNDTQHNDTQHNDTQHNDIQHNDT